MPQRSAGSVPRTAISVDTEAYNEVRRQRRQGESPCAVLRRLLKMAPPGKRGHRGPKKNGFHKGNK